MTDLLIPGLVDLGSFLRAHHLTIILTSKFNFSSGSPRNPSEGPSTMWSWGTLPAEIRSMILEMVAEDYRYKYGHYTLAGYASICREWQLVFEPRNFQRLVLDQERIPDLEQVMRSEQRRNYLGHLFLRVRLDDYDCTVCKSKEDRGTIKKNNDIFSRAVWNLLVILSKWTGFTGSHLQRGLTLELGACSPSDSKHAFRDFHLEDNYPYQEIKDVETHWEAYKLRANKLGLDRLHDPYHGFVNGRQDDISLRSKQRIMGTLTIKSDVPEFSTSFQAFPKVEIVTGLLIRRQFYRRIAANSLRKLLRETFTRLRWFRHEAWHNVSLQQQSRFEKDYKSLISSNLPSTLRGLFIFEDFNKLLHPERSTNRANPSLGKALSKSSRCLENLSAAFLVDANDFFTDFRPTKVQKSNVIPWENLRRLALTSRLLHPGIGRGKVNKLLIAAGQATAFMPKLELMEIWNGGEGHTCLFRYNNCAGEPKITWASNWGSNVQLDYNVIHCWANLPRHSQHPHSNLTIVVDRIKKRRKQVKTYVTTIGYSEMRGVVLDVISEYQLSWEEYNSPKG